MFNACETHVSTAASVCSDDLPDLEDISDTGSVREGAPLELQDRQNETSTSEPEPEGNGLAHVFPFLSSTKADIEAQDEIIGAIEDTAKPKSQAYPAAGNGETQSADSFPSLPKAFEAGDEATDHQSEDSVQSLPEVPQATEKDDSLSPSSSTAPTEIDEENLRVQQNLAANLSAPEEEGIGLSHVFPFLSEPYGVEAIIAGPDEAESKPDVGEKRSDVDAGDDQHRADSHLDDMKGKLDNQVADSDAGPENAAADAQNAMQPDAKNAEPDMEKAGVPENAVQEDKISQPEPKGMESTIGTEVIDNDATTDDPAASSEIQNPEPDAEKELQESPAVTFETDAQPITMKEPCVEHGDHEQVAAGAETENVESTTTEQTASDNRPHEHAAAERETKDAEPIDKEEPVLEAGLSDKPTVDAGDKDNEQAAREGEDDHPTGQCEAKDAKFLLQHPDDNEHAALPEIQVTPPIDGDRGHSNGKRLNQKPVPRTSKNIKKETQAIVQSVEESSKQCDDQLSVPFCPRFRRTKLMSNEGQPSAPSDNLPLPSVDTVKAPDDPKPATQPSAPKDDGSNPSADVPVPENEAPKSSTDMPTEPASLVEPVDPPVTEDVKAINPPSTDPPVIVASHHNPEAPLTPPLDVSEANAMAGPSQQNQDPGTPKEMAEDSEKTPEAPIDPASPKTINPDTSSSEPPTSEITGTSIPDPATSLTDQAVDKATMSHGTDLEIAAKCAEVLQVPKLTKTQKRKAERRRAAALRRAAAQGQVPQGQK